MTTPAFSKTVYIPKDKPCELTSDYGEFRVVQNQNVVEMVAVKDTKMTHYTSADTAGYAGVAKGNPARLEPWVMHEIVKDSTQSTHAFTSSRRLGLIAVQGQSYLFWVDSLSKQVLAAALTPATQNNPTNWCLVTDVNGLPLTLNTAGICAMPGIEDGEVILTYMVGVESTLTIKMLKLHISAYNPNANLWASRQAVWSVAGFTGSILPSQPSFVDYDASHFGVTSLLVPQTVFNTTLQTMVRVNTVVAAVWLETHDVTDGEITTFYFSVNDDVTAQSGSTVTGIPWHQKSGKFYRDGEGINLSIDPAGRILAVFGDADSGDDITVATMPRISDFLPGATGTDIGWTDRGKILNEDTEGPISVIYSQCPTRNSSNQSFPVIAGFFWLESTFGNSSKVMASSLHYCDFQVDISVVDPEVGHQNSNLLEFVCDPFPMPLTAPYVWGNASPDGMADWTLVEYEVLNGKDHNITHEVNATLGFGVQGEWKGGGWQFNGHIVGGAMWQTLDLDAKWEATSIKMQTKGYPNPYFAPDAAAPYLIRPYSAYFGKTLFSLKKVTGTATNLAFFSSGDTLMTSLPLYVPTVNPSRADSVAGDLFSYACTPGDVASYTEAKINAQMLALFIATKNALQAQGQNIYDIFKDENGNDLTHFYTGQAPSANPPTPTSNNYVQDVIDAYGDTMSITGAKYICINFSGSVVGDGQYRTSASNTTGSGGYVEGSFYGGMGGDIGYLQIGFEFSVSKMNSVQNSTSFGIGLKSYLNTMAPTQAMTTRLYLLKASSLWSLEAQYFPTHARDLYLQRLATMRDRVAASGHAQPLAAGQADLSALDGVVSDPTSVLFTNSMPRRALFVVSQWDSGPSSSLPLSTPGDDYLIFPATLAIETLTSNRYVQANGSSITSYQNSGGGTVTSAAMGQGTLATYQFNVVATGENGVPIVTIESVQYPNRYLRTDGTVVNLQYGSAQGMEYWEVIYGPNRSVNLRSAYKTGLMLAVVNNQSVGMTAFNSSTFNFTLVPG